MRHLVIAAVLVAAGMSQAEAAEKKPNIILIMTDDQGYGDLGCHGNPHLKTPNLDRLQKESVRFTDFHVSPTCAPTRSALLTGRHEFKNGVSHTINERERLTLKATTLPQVLKKAGYTTGIFGKWHLGDEDEYQPGRRGFDEVFIHGAGGIGQSYACSCGDAPGNKYFDPVIRHNGKFVKTDGYCTDVFFARAMSWMDEVKGKQPFFLYLTPNAPHAPLDCPPGSEKPYLEKVPANVAKFYGMIANIDENVGKLLTRLKERKLENDTLVIFMTDNGTATGEKVFNAGMRGAKNTPYTGGTRVPAFWRWPGRFSAGVDVAPLTCHWDILPTLADLVGVKIEGELVKQVEGRTLMPLLKDAKAEWKGRYFVSHIGRWAKGQAEKSQYNSASIRDARWQLVFTNATTHALFDLKNDPGEAKDVAEQHPDVVKRLKAAFDAWWKEALPGLVNEDVPMAKENPYRTAYFKQYGGPGPNNVPVPKIK